MLAFPHLLGTCLPSLCSPPFPLHATVSITPLVKVRLSLTLSVSHLRIWLFEQTILFLFLLAKTALAYLPIALFVALGTLFSFQQAQYAHVFRLKPAPFCKLSDGLGSTKKFATSLYSSLSVLSPMFPFISNSLSDLAGTVFSFLLYKKATMGLRTLVSLRKRRG